MRPTFLGFETQKRTLQVAQKNLDIAGNNISNINTVGYTRQRVDLYAMYVSGNRSLRWCSNTNNPFAYRSGRQRLRREPDERSVHRQAATAKTPQ